MFVDEVQVRQHRHECLAGILLITFSVIVNAVFQRLVGGCRIASLDCCLDIQCEMPAIVHECDTGRVEICSLYTYDCVLCRVSQKCHILIRVGHITASKSGE